MSTERAPETGHHSGPSPAAASGARSDRRTLRARLRAQRRAVDDVERERAERAAGELLVAAVQQHRGSTAAGSLALYLPSDGELSPLPGTRRLTEAGWSTWLPVVSGDGTLRFRAWREGEPLTPNRFGIGEPTAGAPELPTAALDVIVVPCVALDRTGNRLGMGGGYYDRTLAPVRDQRRSGRATANTGERERSATYGDPLLIGLAFGFQVVEYLEPDHWDVPVDLVVTEAAVLSFGG